ncbi:MAG: UDP-N-acetylglucosamine 2-epimerase, partial [Gemmatimonadaceae bacterium]
MDKRRLCVLTTGRQDFGILRSTLLLLRDASDFELLLVVGGMHLDARFGETAALIRAENLPVANELDFIDDRSDPAQESARALGQMAALLAARQPDALLLVGDRSETLAAAHAAVLCGVPVAHLHGGEETEGAIDNVFRHAITKLSHLHLVSHAQHARRVLQMGEPPESVVVVGAPGLDNRFRDDLPGREELQRLIGAPLIDPVVIVTMHPTTLGGRPAEEVGAVAAAMARVPATYVVTQPNSDAGSVEIREFWRSWTAGRKGVSVVDALGERAYWG